MTVVVARLAIRVAALRVQSSPVRQRAAAGEDHYEGGEQPPRRTLHRHTYRPLEV